MKTAMLLCFALLMISAVSKSDYKVTNTVRNSTSVTLTLTYTGSDDYYVKPTSPIVKTLRFVFHTLAFNDFVVKITDGTKQRFEVPQYGIFPIDPLANFSFPIANSAVNFEFTENPFDFRITRKQNNAVLFSTYDKSFIFSDHYLEIGSEVDSDYLYGLGERFSESFRKKDGKWSIFNRDRGQVIDHGTGRQTYGFYPFYMLKERGTLFHVNYLRNSNAMDVVKETASNKHYVTWKVIGGIFDFRFILGEQFPEATIERLNNYMGRSEIPPFWGLGFHQCRWGYKNASALQQVISNFEKNKIPLDTIWTDIDYMLNYEDFTIDESRYPLSEMKKITDNYHYIPIIDAGIKNSGYAYEEGLKRNVFVRDGDGKVLIGKVWPGETAFVDFFQPNATIYWGDMLDRLHQKVKFSGVWLDMNEYANFCDGACSPQSGKAFDYSKDLPYQPGEDNIESHTIPLNSTHYNGLSEADVHSYAGMMETYATNTFLKWKNLKPFIISRSSTFGTHKFGYHWTGDNYVSFQYLRGSIADNFNSQLWGIQMVGPDICGFGGNTTVQLCARWFQIGSLYPFARNHNEINANSQEAYALGPVVMAAATNNLKVRYALLKYYYQVFVNKRGLGTVFRPLFFAFPQDQNVYVDQISDTQFMIGNELMAAPIVEAGKTSRAVYFPGHNWYDIYNGKLYKNGTDIVSDVRLNGFVPLFLRQAGGLFYQKVDGVTKTKQLDNRFFLLGAFAYDSARSNVTHKIYRSAAGVLSISDYNNDTKVDLCSRQGCEYIFNMILTIDGKTRNLQLDITYFGGPRLNEEIWIDAVVVLYEETADQKFLSNPIQVTGPRRVIIPLDDATKGYSFPFDEKLSSIQVKKSNLLVEE